MLLLVGLGNPGQKHARDRHNIGFVAVDRIMETHGFGPARARFRGLLAEGRLGGKRCFILKPQTYMNESGQAVGEFQRFFKLDVDRIIVFHDELDLPPGKLRVKTGGGVAGHNGLRSIARHIGPDFRRVRLGIGHPGHKARVHSYVLSSFSSRDMDWLEPLLEAVARHAPLLAADQDSSFMNKVHTDTSDPA
jgi:PTH1 family peptidyl-tRNA hydrolase